jgi:hypothetical protein
VGRHRGQPIGESPQLPSSCGNAGNDLNTDPPRVPLAPPHGDGVGHGGAEANRDTPFPPLKRTCFRPMHRGPPRRVVCLATGQHRQQTGRRREACAQTNRWCLSACLTPTTGRPPAHHRAQTPPSDSRRTGGLPPLPRWSAAITQGVYPGRGPPLPGRRRGHTGSGEPIGASNTRVASHNWVKNRTFLAADSLCTFARVLPDHVEVMCQHPGHNHPAGRPRTR